MTAPTSSTAAKQERVPDPLLRPPVDRQRVQALVVAITLVALVPVAMWQTGMSLARLADSVGNLIALAERMWPPNFVEWRRYFDALIETVFMVAAGTAIALLLSIPCAFLAARNTTTGRIAYSISRGVIVFTRAVPDIVWAMIFVRAVGIGPLAGVMAMAVNSVGMLGKFYADAVEEVKPGPLEAIRSTGGSRLQTLGTGVLPQVLGSWIALGLYRVDINVRSAVILGYVGAGGIGLELQRVQGQLAYDRVLTIILLVFALIVLVEQLSNGLRRLLVEDAGPATNPFGLRAALRRYRERRSVAEPDSQRIGISSSSTDRSSAGVLERNPSMRPPWTNTRIRIWITAGLACALVLISMLQLDISWERVTRGIPGLANLLSLMVPPDFVTGWSRVASQLLETFWIAVAATGLGAALSLPFAVLGARNVSPNRSFYRLARAAMVIERGIPELILAILFVVAVGLGPFAGVLALTVGAIGFTGKLMADAIEELPLDGAEAIRAGGASWLQWVVSGVIPQAVPSFVGTIIYTFDTYIRAATILGIVGAGGIGVMLDSTMSARQFDRTAAIILLIFVVVYASERFSGYVRAKLI